MRMFGIVLISIFTLMHIYVFRRAASVPFVQGTIPPRLLIAIGAALWASVFLAFFLGHGRKGPWAATLELVGMDWMAVLFLAFVSLLVVDLVTGFGFFPLRRLAPTLRGWALIVAGILSVIAIVQGVRPPVVKNYEVRLSGLPSEMDGTVVVAVSDLHLGSLLGGRWLEARAAQIRALQPDLVMMVGDLFEGHGYQGELLPILRRISAPLGVWVVQGNHEFYGDRNANLRLMEEAGFQVLRDRWAIARPGLVLAGVDDLTVARQSGREVDKIISKALAGRPPGATILLSHTPWQAEEAEAAGADLMLCGHTHGGQVWPFGYLVRLFYPLMVGRYDVSGMPVIVSRGTGTWGPRMRLWRRGEILCITLKEKPGRGS